MRWLALWVVSLAAVGCGQSDSARAIGPSQERRSTESAQPPASKLTLVESVPGVTCVARGDLAIVEGEGSAALADHWLAGCLPTSAVTTDAALVAGAGLSLDGGSDKPRATGVTRGVVTFDAGYHRKGMRWAARLAFGQGGLSGVVVVDAVSGAKLSREGALTGTDAFWELTSAKWGGTQPARGYRPPNIVRLTSGRTDVEYVVYDVRCLKAADCHPEHLDIGRFCNQAQSERCVERLEAEFMQLGSRLRQRERPLAVLAQKGADVQWLTDGAKALAFLGHPLSGYEEASVWLAAEGELVFVTRDMTNYPTYVFRFDDRAHPLEPGACAGFYVERSGGKFPLCLPKPACHAPTAAQRSALPASAKTMNQVCETGDGGFSFTTSENGCPCETTMRAGAEVARKCAPCAQREGR